MTEARAWDAVCTQYDISPTMLRSRCRLKRISEARAFLCYLLRYHVRLSWRTVASRVARSHGTCQHLAGQAATYHDVYGLPIPGVSHA